MFAVAAATAIGTLTVKTGQNSIEVERQAQALGITRAQYQELAFVADQYGASTKDLTRGLLALDRASVKARAGSKASATAFSELGIHTKDLRGLNPAQLLDRVADGATKAGDRAKVLAALSTLLGARVAQKLAPALLSGAAGMGELSRQAHELGLVLDDDALRTTKEVAVQWRLLKAAGQGLANELAVALAPIVTQVLGGFVGWVRANRELLSQRLEFWVRQLTRALEAANVAAHLLGGWRAVFLDIATGVGMLYLIANLEKVEKLLKAIRIGFTVLDIVATPVLETLGAGAAALGLELAPLLAILAAIVIPITLVGLAVDDFLTFWEGGKSVLGDNLDALQRLIPAFGSVRHLFGALIGLGGSAWRSVALLGGAIASGLAPALQLLDFALRPVIELLTRLQALWDALNAAAGAPLEVLAGLVRVSGAHLEVTSGAVAPALQAGIAGAVQGQVSRVTSSSSVDNSSRAVSQTNNFLGGGSATDHLRAMEPALRKAGLAVAGGRR